MPTYAKMAPTYTAYLSRAKITREQAADQAAVRIIANKDRYVKVSEMCGGVPWEFIGVTHLRESNLNFQKNLHNGESLSVKTRLKPRGRGPFSTWEESAYDALCVLKGLDKIKDWSDERMAYELERYNGFGYANKGLPSPYLWAGTTIYKKGKYVSDGVYDSSHVDNQLGCFAVVLRIRQLQNVTTKELRGTSRKFNFFKRAQAWFLSLAPVGGVAEYMGWIETAANWSWNHRYILLAGGVAVGYGVFKWLEIATKTDYQEGRYLPSGEKLDNEPVQ